MQVELTPKALDDIEDIRCYVAQDNPRAAELVVSRLIRACTNLGILPQRGRPGLIDGSRELVAVRPYIIVYRFHAHRIDILRIWHAAQSRPPDPP